MTDLSNYKYDGDGKFKLSKIITDDTGKFESKEQAEKKLNANVSCMKDLQSRLYAHDKYALLLIFQAMDTAGKDGAIKHVMSGLNPQGTQVYCFKQPSSGELDHDYLWRVNKCLPERGRIGIFNRSYYEEVLVVKVHNLVENQKIPEKLIKDDIWKKRYHQIRNYEKYLYENGIIPIKFYLHISKEEQKKRLLERIEDSSKNWKFSEADIKEREYWDDYQKCYEEAINETGTEYAPWYIIPSDKKWYARYMISEIIIQQLKKLKLKYPELSEDQLKMLQLCKETLLKEDI
ncbi:MAG: polyphosphate kinase 2 family protein [Bacillota bacterium]|nr:polyphosphate kinase 2 family protein [Bacillota bacterium]